MQAEEPITIILTMPAEVILDIMENDGARLPQCIAHPPLYFREKPLNTTFLHQVLHTCMLAVLAIAKITLDCDNRLHNRKSLFDSDIAQGCP